MMKQLTRKQVTNIRLKLIFSASTLWEVSLWSSMRLYMGQIHIITTNFLMQVNKRWGKLNTQQKTASR